MHPAEYELPVSHDSDPIMIPSPQLGVHCPCELAEYPETAQVRHCEADLQFLQDPVQATHPLVESKYCPSGQVIACRTSFSQIP